MVACTCCLRSRRPHFVLAVVPMCIQCRAPAKDHSEFTLGILWQPGSCMAGLPQVLQVGHTRTQIQCRPCTESDNHTQCRNMRLQPTVHRQRQLTAVIVIQCTVTALNHSEFALRTLWQPGRCVTCLCRCGLGLTSRSYQDTNFFCRTCTAYKLHSKRQNPKS